MSRELIQRARIAHVPVIYIQHNTGTEIDGTEIWQLHPAITPQPEDTTIQKCHFNAFADTKLHEKLQQKGITHIIVTGVQTEYCVSHTCRGGFALGYQVSLVQDAHSTNSSEDQSAVEKMHQCVLDLADNITITSAKKLFCNTSTNP